MVNSAPGFNMQPSVINGFSDLILKLYGPEQGAHSRSAVGLAELPTSVKPMAVFSVAWKNMPSACIIEQFGLRALRTADIPTVAR